MSSLAERLKAARRQQFVGRQDERVLFQSAVEATELPFALLYLFGPGGVGKTSLLHEFAHIAAELETQLVHLDGRNIEATPDLFLSTLQQHLDLPDTKAIIPFLTEKDGRTLILIDTAELLTPLDGWLRDVFLPQLPGNVLVVLAGRNPPSLRWRTDPGWQTMMRVLQLRNLTLEESRSYLARRQIPADTHDTILDFTHGYPLALSLVADVFQQRPATRFRPEESPNVIKTLLDQFVQEVPSPEHRSTLEACALVRLTNESLLAALLQLPDAHPYFEWLRDLSFVEAERRGLYPHDLAREALATDLRWRNPDRYAELHTHARNYYLARVQEGNPREQRRNLSDYIFLHRDNPAVRPYFEWQSSGMVFTDVLRPDDEKALLAMVKAHEGTESVQLASHWLARQPQGVNIFRETAGKLQGCMIMVSLEKVKATERALDPGVQATWQYLQQHAPLRPGETATLFRFWMAQGSYQAVSPVQSRIFLNMVQHYLTTPGLAYTFISCADADFWTEIFAYADLARLEAADFEVGGRRYGIYGHDWRVTPPLTWLSLMAEREITSGAMPTSPASAERLLVLSESDFKTAVRDAFRDFSDIDKLKRNPLLWSRLVVKHANAGSSSDERVTVLRELMRETAVSLQQSPRQTKFFRAIYHTYFQPADTQEQASELLNLPFSTYRRHLRSGIATITDRFWQQELDIPNLE